MDVYQSNIEYLSTFPIFEAWHDVETILRRAASTSPRDWRLPVVACEALGKLPEDAIPASAALACAQISIILVDDMLDEDPRGEYHRIGHGRAANLAAAFQAAGMDALIGSQASTQVKLEALKGLNQMLLRTAHGQDLDVQNPVDESSYWRVVKHKSAPFYGCGLHLGALFGEATIPAAKRLEHLGEIYGEMIQIHDDLNDTMAIPANADWLQGRTPLPILFAQIVDHPDRAKFMELYKNISSGNALQGAQDILIRCGALSYCVDQLLRRHQAAQEILNKTPLPNQEKVHSLLEEGIAPVQKLFETLGVSPGIPPTIGERWSRA
ncbi:MAG TPA: polyprenyl synthetase family protein [Anaerolineales bacterium]|nr:polyprenyl synthetase family protein [Anaerolineales bacterium]